MTFDNVPNSASPKLHLREQAFLTMDVHSPEIHCFNMSRIKGKDSYPETMLRRCLWANGYRNETVILVHGCCWRRHCCLMTSTPATRRDIWQSKFQDKVSREKRNTRALIEAGWPVMIVRECTLRGKTPAPKKVEDQITRFLMSVESFSESGT